MRLAELTGRLQQLISEEKYIEAFSIKSMYVEGVITILSTAFVAHKAGFDGRTKSITEGIKQDEKVKKFFEKSISLRLEEKIKNLKESKVLTLAQSEKLHLWRTKYRNQIFHNFVEKMLQLNLEENAKNGYDYLVKITDEQWFKNMEKSLVQVESLINL